MIALICNGGLGAHKLHAILLSKRYMPVTLHDLAVQQ